MRSILTFLLSLATAVCVAEPRARDLGVPFDGEPGPLNAITDVAGIAVGHTTLIQDLTDGHRVRTGVTAILPRGRADIHTPVFGGWFSLNGNGEMTGTTWIEESGQLDGPVLLTNTHSVGVVRDAVIAWRIRQGEPDASGYWWSLPVVAETWDGHLNDVNGFHVKPAHVDAALDTAAGGAVAEGNVGGGTGMICHEFKCGIGTSSRRVAIDGRTHTVGVLVQANYGLRETLRIAGVPIGRHLREHRAYQDQPAETGSIIIVVATVGVVVVGGVGGARDAPHPDADLVAAARLRRRPRERRRRAPVLRNLPATVVEPPLVLIRPGAAGRGRSKRDRGARSLRRGLVGSECRQHERTRGRHRDAERHRALDVTCRTGAAGISGTRRLKRMAATSFSYRGIPRPASTPAPSSKAARSTSGSW